MVSNVQSLVNLFSAAYIAMSAVFLTVAFLGGSPRRRRMDQFDWFIVIWVVVGVVLFLLLVLTGVKL